MLLQNEQRTADWFEARIGRITASLAAACLGLDPHKGPLAAFNAITGRSGQSENKHTAWGKEFEDHAREAYEVETGQIVWPTGFWVHDSYSWLGASPDGLVGTDGLVECKCPSILPTEVPIAYAVQIFVQMACTNRAWCDFFAWNQNGHYLQRVHAEKMPAELIPALEQWYRAHIVPDVAPPRSRPKGEKWNGFVWKSI